jgi:septal ring factor EnvC (AmiA/AmiB activator)
MTTTEERLGTLEVRVDNLETWAGPGQAQALAEGQRELRAELAKVQRTQDRHTRMLADLISDVSGLKTDVSGLKADVAILKADVAELKSGMAEILRRLPAPPAGA